MDMIKDFWKLYFIRALKKNS